jgi:hypothetical protein
MLDPVCDAVWRCGVVCRCVAGCCWLAFLVDFLQAAAYLTGAAVPGRRAEKGGSGGVGRCGTGYSFVVCRDFLA